jgi:hypothetical protein
MSKWQVYTPLYLTQNKFTFCTQCVFEGLVWFSEQTAIPSLNSTNQLILVTETHCVLRDNLNFWKYLHKLHVSKFNLIMWNIQNISLKWPVGMTEIGNSHHVYNKKVIYYVDIIGKLKITKLSTPTFCTEMKIINIVTVQWWPAEESIYSLLTVAKNPLTHTLPTYAAASANMDKIIDIFGNNSDLHTHTHSCN